MACRCVGEARRSSGGLGAGGTLRAAFAVRAAPGVRHVRLTHGEEIPRALAGA